MTAVPVLTRMMAATLCVPAEPSAVFSIEYEERSHMIS